MRISPDFILDRNLQDPAVDPPLGIVFTHPTGGEASLAVYNVAGLRVRALHRSLVMPGIHRMAWDGRDDRGETVQPGLYLVVLERSGRRDIRRVVVRPR